MTGDDRENGGSTIAAARAPRAGTLDYVRPGSLPPKPLRLSVLGAIGMFFAGVWFLVFVFVMVFFAAVWWVEPPRVRAVRPAAVPGVSLTAYDGDEIGIDGLKEPLRSAVVTHVRQRLKLTADRAEMLDRLLADMGARIFPREAGLEPFDTNLVHEAGQLDGGPDGDGARGSHFFTTQRGRVEISDFAASFEAIADRRRTRLTYNVIQDGDDPPRWSARSLREALESLYRSSGGQMTALQAAALLRDWRDEAPGARAGWQAWPHVLMPIWWQSGTLSYHPAIASPAKTPVAIWLLPDGRKADFRYAPHGIDPLSGVPYVPAKPLGYRYWPGSRGSFALIALLALPEVFLSAYLFAGAAMLLYDPFQGARRHARLIALKVPLLVLGMIALVWWMRSLREYGHLLSSGDVWMLSAIAVVAMLAYPLLVVAVLRSRRSRHFFVSHAMNPWQELADARRACAAAGAVCVLAGQRAAGQGLIHLLGTALSGWAGVWFARRSTARRTRSVAGNALAIGCIASLSAMLSTGAAAQSSDPSPPPTPWQISEFLNRARGSDPTQAQDAVRKLAAAREPAQEALLQLLDGPEPPIGIPAVLSAIGQIWFDTDARWSERHWRAALRLTPEWIEIIRDSDDVRTMAALEALGPAAELEPLLRPLLTSPHDAIRKRSAALVLKINPDPVGMVRLLRRELDRAPSGRQRQDIVRGLVNLRPAADSVLTPLLAGTDANLRLSTMEALIDAHRPLSDELRPAARPLADDRDARVHRPAMRLLGLDPAGRRELIELALGDGATIAAASEAVEGLWPQCEPLLRHVRSARPEQRQDIARAARQILFQVNQHDGQIVSLAAFTQDADEELQFQAKLVLAEGQYSMRLGPQTYGKTQTAPGAAAIQLQASARPDWRARKVEAASAWLSPPPQRATAGLVLLTLFIPLVVLPACLWLSSGRSRQGWLAESSPSPPSPH